MLFLPCDVSSFSEDLLSKVPELIRLLGEKGIDFDEAVEIVTKTCAYTNHTILAEALEKWPPFPLSFLLL